MTSIDVHGDVHELLDEAAVAADHPGEADQVRADVGDLDVRHVGAGRCAVPSLSLRYGHAVHDLIPGL